MKKIAFITHSFHKNTKSANVYIDAIFRDKEKYEISIFYNEEWGDKSRYKKFDKKIENYDAVIVLQLISYNLLNQINSKNIIFIPMYDYSRNFTIEKWLPASGVKILSPVQEMSEKLNLIGLNSYQIKYFPEVTKYTKPDFNKVYFWNRVNKLDYKIVLKLLKSYNFSNLNIHNVNDPGNNPILPSKRDIKKFNITFTKWFDSKQDYYEHLNEYGIYIAPRPFEGGAAAFIDAMKNGSIVIAPNHAPYNEYIVDKKNGFLYNINNPSDIQLGDYDLNKISKSAYEYVMQGREMFNKEIPGIIEFIFNNDKEIENKFYYEKLEKEFEEPWFKFARLSRKDKIKFILKIFSNLSKIKFNKK